MIKVNNLNKYYNKGKDNEIHVINNVSLTLPDHGLVSFLGASGSGKTTLLNVIGGLDKANGEINYDDISIVNYKMKKIDQYRRNEIGYVFQNYNLLLNESVYSNLVIALEMVGIYDKQEQHKRIEYVLNAVGMYKFRKKKADALSGGQQQRVSIARALVKQSKIIIADEPTGNLDHENAIMVMNILKNISKNTLVLLVTHNQELANFYSDQIFELKDGQIIKNYVPTGDSTLENKESNAVYLLDLNKDETSNDSIKVESYLGEKQDEKLTLTVIEKNGTYYLSSNKNIKLLQDSNVKILNKHYEGMKKGAKTEEIYDNSFFKKDKKRRNPFKSFFANIKEAFNNMTGSKRKIKFLYASFVIIGILFGVFIISFSNFVIIDQSNFVVDKSYYTMVDDDFFEDSTANDQIKKLNAEEKLENISRVFYQSGAIQKYINYNESITIGVDLPIISDLDGVEHKLLIGERPNQGEIVISHNIADFLIKNSKDHFHKYDELIDEIIYTSNSSFGYRISGIYDNEFRMSYLNDQDYINNVYSTFLNNYNSLIVRELDEEIINGKKTYKVVEGRDLTEEDLDSNNVLAPVNGSHFIDDSLSANGINFKVVGLYELIDYKLDEDVEEFIVHSTTPISPFHRLEPRTFEYGKIDILEGRLPNNPQEILASLYSDYKVNDTYDIYKVVGIYNGDSSLVQGNLLFERDAFLANIESYVPAFFTAENVSELNQQIEATGARIVSSYKEVYNTALEEQTTFLSVFGVGAAVLLIVLMILIYFLMRSKMISEIYPLGVYRSLGAPKHKIYSKFVYDIGVTVTLTTTIGYLITVIFYGFFARGINNLFGIMILKSSPLFTIIGILLIYVLNFVFGLLPVYLLMRKTPAEILSKYDI